MTEVVAHFRTFSTNTDHAFWPDPISLADDARFQHAATSRDEQSHAQRSFAHCPSANRDPDDDWYDDEPDPFSDEPWNPDTLDDDEPEPEPGDFWPEIDDD